MRTTTIIAAAPLIAMSLTGCGITGGLTAESTCGDFNEAPVAEQRTIIQELVIAKENGQSNPMREANAIMQITYTCQRPGNDDQVLSGISI